MDQQLQTFIELKDTTRYKLYIGQTTIILAQNNYRWYDDSSSNFTNFYRSLVVKHQLWTRWY